MTDGGETGRLLQAATAGDRVALDTLYARHERRLLVFLASRVGSGVARGVLQETYLESVRKLPEFEDRGAGSFYRWLVAIARYKASEAARGERALKRARAEPLADDPADGGTSPSRGAIRAERLERIVAALAALPATQAEAVRLRYLEGLPVAECAQSLGRSEAAVKALVSRGLAELAGRLSGSL